MFKPFGFVKKTWPHGGGAYFPYIIYIENFKNLLVRNHWTDFNIILEKCSFGDSLLRLFKPFGSVKKHGRTGAGLIFPIYLYRKKIFLSETTGPISIYFCRNVHLVILYQGCSSHLDSSKNMAARGRGLFFLYIYVENFKNLLVRNHWTDFNIILQKCSFGDPLPRLFKPFGFVIRHGSQGGGGGGGWSLFCLYIYIENFKNLFVRNYWTDFNIILQKLSSGDSLLRLFKPFGFVKKHGRTGAGLIFPIYLYRKKNLLVRNHWTDFHILLQKCSFGDPLPSLFKPFGFVKKHDRQGRAYFPYISI